eukprot:ANDGO_02352.mRNA.1 4-hydroxyphenylpyruvate dioxygenase
MSTQASRYFGFDHILLWVGNAKQAADWYCGRFGFSRVAYRGLETGARDVVSHVIQQDRTFFVFESPLRPDNAAFGEHMTKHGDGVRDVAFTVEDARACWTKAVGAGAESIREPYVLKDENGEVVLATIRTYGDTVHTFVERKNYNGVFLPGFAKVDGSTDAFTTLTGSSPGIASIDHIVGNQEWDGMLPVEQWYQEKLGFHRFWSVDDKQMHTDYSALRSVVMSDDSELVKMPINEPAPGRKKSQIEEYCEFYGGAGVQHIALSVPDVLHAVANLRARGVEFLSVPKSYYDDLRKRLAASEVSIKEDLNEIEKLSILVDFDDRGYLLQIFTRPLEDRPTLFIEIIQRANNSGFGVGNFKALFEAIEREQDLRGNL